MDEKTERLRDIFLDVADDATVTEPQEDARGSLVGSGAAAADRLADVVETMRERYAFRAGLDDDALVRVVERFYAGDDDADIADALDGDVSPAAVAEARADLHLVTDDDLDAPFDLDAVREAVAADRDAAAVAAEVDADEETVRWYRRLVEAQRERRAVGDRFRAEFDSILVDRALSDRLTAEVKQTGLEDATEGMETDVSF